jgi:hypothetical protein
MTSSDGLYAQVSELLKKGEISQARTILQRALKANPKDERTWMLYVKILSKNEERIQALNWCLKFNPDSAVAKATLDKLQHQSSNKETPSPEQQGSVSGVKSAGHTRGQKPTGRIIIGLLTFFIVVCIVIASLNNLLDTPLLAFGPKYDAATYGITDTAKAVLVIENHSVFYIDSIELTRHQDGQVYELNGVTLEGVGVFPIEPGGYDLAVKYRDLGEDPMFYVDSSATAHFNIRRKRAVIFHLEGGATRSGLLSYTPPDLIGK